MAVEAIEGSGRAERVRIEGGKTVDCDFVVVGIGVTPRIALAEAAGLEVGDGILVDERLRTSHSNVFAAGDVASHRHPFFEQRLRVEHWHNALKQGPAAARSMIGNSEPYDKIPYFFSDQYDVGMETPATRPSGTRSSSAATSTPASSSRSGSRTAACSPGST